jgi:hypothetical protein
MIPAEALNRLNRPEELAGGEPHHEPAASQGSRRYPEVTAPGPGQPACQEQAEPSPVAGVVRMPPEDPFPDRGRDPTAMVGHRHPRPGSADDPDQDRRPVRAVSGRIDQKGGHRLAEAVRVGPPDGPALHRDSNQPLSSEDMSSTVSRTRSSTFTGRRWTPDLDGDPTASSIIRVEESPEVPNGSEEAVLAWRRCSVIDAERQTPSFAGRIRDLRERGSCGSAPGPRRSAAPGRRPPRTGWRGPGRRRGHSG